MKKRSKEPTVKEQLETLSSQICSMQDHWEELAERVDDIFHLAKTLRSFVDIGSAPPENFKKLVTKLEVIANQCERTNDILTQHVIK